jgi:uracil-DNA glycosylase family 4
MGQQTNECLDKLFQIGEGRGKNVLILGESPAENGWRKSGKAFYSPEGKLLASGSRLNELLYGFRLNVEMCGFTELSKQFVGKNRKTLKDSCRRGWPIFIKQITEKHYCLIIILGVTTSKIFSELLGQPLKMGELMEIELAGMNRKVLPIYHPSPINPWGRENNKKIFEKYKNVIDELL